MNERIGNIVDQKIDQLTKDDVMRLLEISLKENDPFAREFTSRVAPHIAKTIQRNIDVSSIKLDGSQIGKHLTQTLQDTADEKIKGISNKIGQKLEQISKNIESANSSAKLKNSIDLITTDTTEEYKSMLRKIITGIKAGIPKDGFNFAEDGKSVKLSDVFKPDPAFGKFTKFRYAFLLNSLITKLNAAVTNVKFKFSGTDEKDNQGKATGTTIHEVKLTDIFNIDKQSSFYTRWKYNRAIRSIIDKLQTTVLDKIDNVQWPDSPKAFMDSLGLSFSPQTLGGKASKQFGSVLEKTPEFIMSDIGDDAIEKLEDMLNRVLKKRKKSGEEESDKKTKAGESGGLWDTVKDLALGALGIKAGGSIFKALRRLRTPFKTTRALGRLGRMKAKRFIGKIGKTARSLMTPTGLGSAATNLLLAKYAIDLGRMAFSMAFSKDKEYRKTKEDELAQKLADPNTSILSKIATGILDLPTAITGILSEREKQADLESQKQDILSHDRSVKVKAFGREVVAQAEKEALLDPAYLQEVQKIKETYAEKQQRAQETAKISARMGGYGTGIQTDFSEELEQKLNELKEERLRQAIRYDKLSKGSNKSSSSGVQTDWNSSPPPGTVPFPPLDPKLTPWQDVGDSQDDFIWRSGQKVTPFNKNDNIISTKDPEVFDRLVKAINQPEYSSAFVTKLGNTDKVLSDLVSGLNTLIKQMKSNPTGNKVLSDGIPTTEGSLPAVDVSTRDPAYILRSRAWDRLREGYVVI